MENNPKLRQHKTETSGEAKANQFPKTPILTFQILLHKKLLYFFSLQLFIFKNNERDGFLYEHFPAALQAVVKQWKVWSESEM